MRPAGRAEALIEVMELVQAEWHSTGAPEDRVIANYFRSRRYIGGGDRRWISASLYDILRHWSHLTRTAKAIGLSATPRSLLMVWLTRKGEEISLYFAPEQQYGPPPITKTETTSLDRLDTVSIEYSDAERCNMPEALFPLFLERFGDRRQEDIQALNTLAPLDIRLNKLRKAISPPSDTGPWQPLSLVPNSYRTTGSPRLTNHQDYHAGNFEIQDESSQICTRLVGAKPGMTVIDFCAGAGGKTLAMAADMADQGRLIAMDINKARLNAMTGRVKRAGARCIEPLLLSGNDRERPTQIEPYHVLADRVLVDAPCSGSGTWRRNPAQRWHYQPDDITRFHKLQIAVLNEAAQCVKPGGRLIYATCSLFRQENELSMQTFLKDHPEFKALDYKDVWLETDLRPMAEPSLATDPDFLQLVPSRHDTDGFFVAILKRFS